MSALGMFAAALLLWPWRDQAPGAPVTPPRPAGVAAASVAAPAPVIAATPLHLRPLFARVKPSRDVRQLATWVLASGDNGGLPFFVVDKRNARLYVFDPLGRARGASTILLGLAHGDDTAPGIGERPLSQILPSERTTPAGRFVGEVGRNAHGKDVVWVDYDAAVSMHRVITDNPSEHRLQRLASHRLADKRISYGCINVPVRFFETQVMPSLHGGKAMVYVLPETRPLRSVFRIDGLGRPPTT